MGLAESSAGAGVALPDSTPGRGIDGRQVVSHLDDLPHHPHQALHSRSLGRDVAGIDNRQAQLIGSNTSVMRDITRHQGVGNLCSHLDEIRSRPGHHSYPLELPLPITCDTKPTAAEGVADMRVEHAQTPIELADSADGRHPLILIRPKGLHSLEADQGGQCVGGPSRCGIEVGMRHQEIGSSSNERKGSCLGRSPVDQPIGGREEQRVIGDQQVDGRLLRLRQNILVDLVAHAHRLHLSAHVTQLKPHGIPGCGHLWPGQFGEAAHDIGDSGHPGDRSVTAMELLHAAEWTPPPHWERYQIIDSHTGGEPFRILITNIPELEGSTVLERRRLAEENFDRLRRVLMWEPRGHADMYGGWLGPPVRDDSHLSVLFLHNEGFSTMCGHGIIALTKVILETGAVEVSDPETVVRIDTPAGQVTAVAESAGGRVDNVRFLNVPSFAVDLDCSLDVPGLGPVNYDLAFGGAFYAYVDAAGAGVDLSDTAQLVSSGRRIKDSISASRTIEHPSDEDLGFLYGVIFTGPATTGSHHHRSVCVFADGEVDRSPTGTGVSGSLAIGHARGDVEVGETIAVESIVGSVFEGRVAEETVVGSLKAVVPEISGTAHLTGRAELWVDPEDPLGDGFFLR